MRLALLLLIAAAACGKVVATPSGTCSGPADCTDPAAPFCVDMACQATCSVNADCTKPGLGLCAPDGTCVACLTNTDCTDPAAPICEAATHECRGCAADNECTDGVCLEAEGTCVADELVTFISDQGSNSAACTRAAPCLTVEAALLEANRVIHVLGGTLSESNVSLTGNHVIDGENTVFGLAGSTAFTIAAGATITVEGVQVNTPPSTANIAAVVISGHGTLYNVTFASNGGTAVSVTNSAISAILHSHIGQLASMNTTEVTCTNAKLTVDQSLLETTRVTSDLSTGPCDVTATRNHFHSRNDGSVQVSGGRLVMENNSIVHEMGFNDSIFASSLGAGSVIRFNTLYNTTPAPSDGAALECDNTVAVTSNIFAYNSMHSITGGGCMPKYSVFDDVSLTAAGTGNQSVGIGTIFVDRQSGDLHPSPTSVARGGAEPGQETMVKIDIDGNPRPNPTGSLSDCGALEVP